MDEKISSLMEKQFKEYIPKHVTKVMKSWGRKNSSGGWPQPPTKPNGNTSNGHGSKGNHRQKTTPTGSQQRRVQSQRGNPKTQENAKTSASSLPRNPNQIRNRLCTPREETETTLLVESTTREKKAISEKGRGSSRNASLPHNPTNPHS
eukprot:scaffold8263_cov35-Attheya_sp.AAC.2